MWVVFVSMVCFHSGFVFGRVVVAKRFGFQFAFCMDFVLLFASRTSIFVIIQQLKNPNNIPKNSVVFGPGRRFAFPSSWMWEKCCPFTKFGFMMKWSFGRPRIWHKHVWSGVCMINWIANCETNWYVNKFGTPCEW